MTSNTCQNIPEAYLTLIATETSFQQVYELWQLARLSLHVSAEQVSRLAEIILNEWAITIDESPTRYRQIMELAKCSNWAPDFEEVEHVDS